MYTSILISVSSISRIKRKEEEEEWKEKSDRKIEEVEARRGEADWGGKAISVERIKTSS